MNGGQDNRRRSGKSRERHLSVRAVRRNPPDLQKLSRALLAVAQAEAEAEAEARASQAGLEHSSKEPDDDDGR
jgi:hypothetical protein